MTMMLEFEKLNQGFELLDSISSRNEKIETLEMILNEYPLFEEICRLALDPFILFGVSKMPAQKEEGSQSLEQAIETLKSLIGNNHSNAQKEALQKLANSVDKEDYEVLAKIVNKDLKCGVSVKTLNKAAKRDIVSEYPCLLVSAFDEKKLKKMIDNVNDDVFVQLKCDGMRVNIVVDEDLNVTLFSRKGKEIVLKDESFYNLFKIPEFKNTVFDGELLIDGDETGKAVERQIGNGILNKAVKGTISKEESERVTAILWDVIKLSDFKKGSSDISYGCRYMDLLVQLLKISNSRRVFPVPTRFTKTYEKALEYANEWMNAGFEGAVIKNPNMKWGNKRSTESFKVKSENDVDLKCINWIAGTEKYDGMLGALTCVSKDMSLIVHVGTGFTDEMRATIKREDVVDKIVTVKYNTLIVDQKTKVKSLFLPRFVEIREDKTEADNL